MDNKLPWNKRMRRLEFRPPYADAKRLVGYLKEINANSLLTGAVDEYVGYTLYPSKMAPMCKLVYSDYMKELISLCHDSDIMVSTWYTPRENRVVWGQKPEWRMLVKESNDKEEHTLEGVLCYINSPYREWAFKHLEEIVSSLDFDGIFFDCSTYGYYGEAAGCYCSWCKNAYLKETGKEIPQKIEWGNPDSDRYISWRYDKYNEWLLELRNRLLKIKSDLVIELNVLNRPHITDINKSFNWRTGIMLQTLPEAISAGSESDAGMYRLCSTNQAAAHSRAMNPAEWNLWMPALNLSCERRGNVFLCDEAPTIEAFKIHAATTLSKGGVPWYGVDLLTKTRRERLKETFGFIKQREAYSGDTLVKDVAIHMSNSARDYYGKDRPENYFAGLLGFFEAVTELHYPVDFVLDDQLNIDNIKKYRALILSNSACLTDKQVEDIGNYVKQGGILIVTHFSSLMDDNKKITDSFDLKDILGVDFGSFSENAGVSGVLRYGGREPVTGEVSILNNAVFVDVKIPEKSSASVLAAINFYDCNFVPYFKYAIENSDYDELEVDNYFEIPEGSRQKPAVTRNVYGRGVAYYCGFDLGGTYLKDPYPGTRKLIENMINENGKAPIRLAAPKSIEFSAMESDNGKKLYLHAVNAPATSVKSPGWHTLASVVDEILPVYGLVAEIRDRSVTKAVNVLTGEKCEIRQDGPCCKVRFDCKSIHEIILVE